MDFDFDSSIGDMTNPASQQNIVSMQQLLNNNSANQAPSHAQLQWTASTQPHQELPAMQLQRCLPSRPTPNNQPSFLPQPMHPQDISSHAQEHPHHMLSSDVKPFPQKPPSSEFPRKDGFPQVNLEIAIQMGGLRYADLRKEQAREWFKDQKKNEHMAKGEFDRMKRRKKGDTSMTPREKYVRRLKMNQDSAAAARYAQEEYVSVLEKLVQSVETELGHVRQQNTVLQKKVTELQSAAEDGTKFNVQSFLDAPEQFRKYDPHALSKWLDMVTSPPPVSAQDNDPNFAAGKMGIQPAPAV